MKKNILKVCIGVVCLAVVVLCFRLQSCSNIASGLGDIPSGYGRVTIAQNQRAITNDEIKNMELRYKFNGVDVPANGFMDFAVGASVEITVDGYVGGTHRMHHVEPPVVVHRGMNVINITLSKSRDEVGGVYCAEVEGEGGYVYTIDEALQQTMLSIAGANGIDCEAVGPLSVIAWGEDKANFFAKLEAAGISTNFIPAVSLVILDCDSYEIRVEEADNIDKIKPFIYFISSKLNNNGIATESEESTSYRIRIVDQTVSENEIEQILADIDRDAYGIDWIDNEGIDFERRTTNEIKPYVDDVENKLHANGISTKLESQTRCYIYFGDQTVSEENIEQILGMKNETPGVISISGDNFIYFFEYYEDN